ncbi:hypothetical protein ACVGOW_30610 [Pseudonocardia saturnea]
MPPELHLDPERLHVHGRRLSAVLDELVPLPALDAESRAALSLTDDGAAVLAELDRTGAAVDRIGRELTDLAAVLHTRAFAAAAADARATGGLTGTLG